MRRAPLILFAVWLLLIAFAWWDSAAACGPSLEATLAEGIR